MQFLSYLKLFYTWFGPLYKLAKSVVIHIEEELEDGTGSEKKQKADQVLKDLIRMSDDIEESFEDLAPIWDKAVTTAVALYNSVGRFTRKVSE